MTRNNSTRSLVILGLMTAILIVFSFTPIGTIPIGPLSITLNIIPIAIAAAALGPAGGAAMGAVFGLLSFLQCLGIGIPSGMGATLFSINPFLAFVQRFVPRLLDGFLVGLIFRGCEKAIGYKPAGFIRRQKCHRLCLCVRGRERRVRNDRFHHRDRRRGARAL